MSLQPGSRRLRTAAVGAVCVGLLAAGCGSSNGGSSGGGDSGTLIVFTGQSGDYQRNFNPYSPTLNEGPGTIFEPLFFYNIAQQAEPQPRLGTEFSWNDDGTELTITLRDGVTWTDGQPFTAEDVAFTFDMLADHAAINTIGYDGDAAAVDDTHVSSRSTSPPTWTARSSSARSRSSPSTSGRIETRPPTPSRTPSAPAPTCWPTSSRRRSPTRPTPTTGAASPSVKKRPLPRALRQPGRRRRAGGRPDRLADRTGPRHREHRRRTTRLPGAHRPAEPDAPGHLLQRRARLQGPADRPGRPPRPLLRHRPDAAQRAGVPGHRQRDLPRLRPARARTPLRLRRAAETGPRRWSADTEQSRSRSWRTPATPRAPTASTPRTASGSR